ncbi:MAG: hypothetical protein SGJ20_17855 [Planctomycetota bacterium]|nr:hypothetical protein [Planctomycetota bacterium]
MLDWMYLIGWNQLIAVAMGVAVWLICRTRVMQRRPALCHGLWLLVLIKLVTPPFLSMSVLLGSSIAVGVPSATEASVFVSSDSHANSASVISMSATCRERRCNSMPRNVSRPMMPAGTTK